ncbi:MAG TPA: hypothetical protein EYQ27_13860 [Gemmatimonadetes bacterium]|nr:hypothetical protein [Gemmatimonadota bacterium]
MSVELPGHGSHALSTFAGTAATTRLNWATSNWTLSADGCYFDQGFRADAGFVTQAGIRGGHANLARRWWGGSDRWFTQIRLNVGTWNNRDFAGNQINGGGFFGLEYQGPGQSRIGIYPNFAMKEHFAGTTYAGMKQLWFNAYAAPSGMLSGGLDGTIGDAIDFANERLGSETRLSPSVTLRLGRNVEVTVRHTYQRMSRDGAEVFTANLSQLRGVYNFSPRSFFRVILQYQQPDRALDRYVDDVDASTQQLFAQLLYAYKMNPQTVLFLGYSQDGDGLVDPDRQRVPLTTRGRTFFLKIGYASRP